MGGIDFGWRNPFAALAACWTATTFYGSAGSAISGRRRCTNTRRPCGTQGRRLVRRPGRRHGDRGTAGVGSEGAPRADNDIRLGIAAVSARLRTGRLKVHGPACPHLLDEARLYRYPTASERASINENPVDEHNHALGALRYLISALDARFIAKLRKRPDAKPADNRGPDGQPGCGRKCGKPIAGRRSGLGSESAFVG